MRLLGHCGMTLIYTFCKFIICLITLIEEAITCIGLNGSKEVEQTYKTITVKNRLENALQHKELTGLGDTDKIISSLQTN